MKLEIYTDGSATVKTKPGGYGWVLVKNGEKIDEGSGYIPFASNNDAELEAAIQGLMVVYKYIEKHFFYGCGANLHTPDSYHVTLVSDSQIILNWASGISQFKQQNKLDKYRALQLFVKRMNAQMHKIIMNPPEGFVIDHINGDTLDNRKENLRVVHQSVNMRNRKSCEGSTSGYVGVHRHSQNKNWCAQIKFDGKTHHIGVFESQELAKEAREAFIIKHNLEGFRR